MRDWSVGPISKQSELAADAPDVLAFAVSAIELAGRRDHADMKKVLMGISRVLDGQMDAYAHGLPTIDANQVTEMREIIYSRPDFRFEMLFYGLTYFGPSGVAMCNGLVEQLDVFRSQLVELISDGKFD